MPGLHRTSAIHDFLDNLTPTRAFILFVVALAAGALLVWKNWFQPWGYVLPVFVYGGLLAYVQRSLYVEIDPTVKDSPYFLGFMLTLFGLAGIFLSLEESEAGQVAIGPIVGEAGAALMATVLGLFMRQLLLAVDPGSEERDAVFRSLARQVRESTVEFHREQEKFVSLVREFVKSREKWFTREEKAFGLYVERLEAGGELLGRLETDFPARITSLVGELEASATRISATTKVTSDEFSSWREEIGKQIKQEGKAYSERLKKAGEAVEKSRSAVDDELSTLLKSLKVTVGQFATYSSKINSQLASQATSAHELVTALGLITTKAQQAKVELQSLADQARKSGKSLAESGQLARKTLDKSWNEISKDVAAIDQVLDDLSSILTERLRKLKM